MTYLNIITKRFDRSLVLLIFSLCGLGTVMMYSASVSESLNISGGLSNSLYLQSHIKKLLLGFFSLIFFANLDYRKIKPFSPYMLFLSIALLIATKASYLISGDQSAARWLNLGLFSLQTSAPPIRYPTRRLGYAAMIRLIVSLLKSTYRAVSPLAKPHSHLL